MDETTAREIASQLRKPHGERGYETGDKMNNGNREMNERVISRIRELNPQRALEIGFGNGHFIQQLFAGTNLTRYTGVDFSPEMIDAAGRNNAQALDNGSVVLHESHADQLPVENASQDLVFAVNVLYFWENPARELAEIRRVLKPGGNLLLAIRPAEQMRHLPFTAHGFLLYSPEELQQLAEHNGFSCLELSTAESDSFTMNDQAFYLESTLALFLKNA